MFALPLLLVTLHAFSQAAQGEQACARDSQVSDYARFHCEGDQQLRRGRTLSRGTLEWRDALERAITHYREALRATSERSLQEATLLQILEVYERRYLNQQSRVESVLRELILVNPTDVELVYRLSRAQEDQGLFDAAEDTLLSIRRLYPDTAENYKRLAQFYSRRAHAVGIEEQRAAGSRPDAPGITGSKAPRRIGKPVYPPEALAAGARGPVGLELTVDEQGRVVGARVVQSSPLLDDAAVAAASQWRYEPTIVNGRPVPVTIFEQVDFELPE
jgi:TonB family protein